MIEKAERASLDPPVGVEDHVRGPQAAPVTLVEYGDYECSRSGQAYHSLENVRQQLGDQLRVVFRHFPMTQVHRHAQHAAEVAEAAGAQDRFWEMHDTLFAHQEALGNGYLVEYADGLGLNMRQFLRDMARH